MSNFRHQYNRMVRWRNRIKEDSQPEPEAAFDVFFAFAQACYHLVDWLENDRSQPIRRADADGLVAESDVLSFCRDICNGSKHATLEAKRVRLSTNTTPGGWLFERQDDGSMSEGKPTYAYEVVLDWQNGQVSALEFADRCIKEWVRILRTRDLVPRRWDAQHA